MSTSADNPYHVSNIQICDHHEQSTAILKTC